MAVSERNRLGVGGANKLSAREAQLNDNDGMLRGVQPFGALSGEYRMVDSDALFKQLGTNWISTIVDGGTDGAHVQAIQAATSSLPPFLRLTTNDADNDSNQLQYALPVTAGSTTVTAAGGAMFIPRAGHVISFEAEIRVTTTVANSCFLIGLPIVDTTLVASGAIGVAEGIFFSKADASASCLGHMRINSTSTTVTAGTVVANTWHKIGFRLSGVTDITYSFDGVDVGSSTVTNIPTAVLCPSIALATTTTAVATMDVRRFFVGQEAI